MDGELEYYKEQLESLIDDLNAKSKEELQKIISKLENKDLESGDVIKIQEDLEQFTATCKMDSFTRTGIMNIITDLEGIYNG